MDMYLSLAIVKVYDLVRNIRTVVLLLLYVLIILVLLFNKLKLVQYAMMGYGV